MSSYVFESNYNPGSVAGTYFDQGMQSLVDLGNKYPDNETVGGMVVGTQADAARTQINTGLALGYNQAMSSHLANLQQGMENLRTGNTLKLMGAEGRIAQDLYRTQGEQQRLGIKETGAQQRLNIGAQGTQDRMNIRETGSEQRKGIVTAGQQERLNIGKRFQEERNMRADARGAIRSMGARFFG
tara:strand:- start:1850 stop:2404 length:555 start_codon:yes stop_codon:yes gene_type:complete